MRDGGKGDKQILPKDKEQFDSNWDNIFKKVGTREMNTLYEEALQRILELQDLLIAEQNEVLRLMDENQFFKDLMGDVEILRKEQERSES